MTYDEMVERFPVGSTARVKASGRVFVVQGHKVVYSVDPWVVESEDPKSYWSAGQIEPVQS